MQSPMSTMPTMQPSMTAMQQELSALRHHIDMITRMQDMQHQTVQALLQVQQQQQQQLTQMQFTMQNPPPPRHAARVLPHAAVGAAVPSVAASSPVAGPPAQAHRPFPTAHGIPMPSAPTQHSQNGQLFNTPALRQTLEQPTQHSARSPCKHHNHAAPALLTLSAPHDPYSAQLQSTEQWRPFDIPTEIESLMTFAADPDDNSEEQEDGDGALDGDGRSEVAPGAPPAPDAVAPTLLGASALGSARLSPQAMHRAVTGHDPIMPMRGMVSVVHLGTDGSTQVESASSRCRRGAV
jgi:hypothetical protein